MLFFDPIHPCSALFMGLGDKETGAYKLTDFSVGEVAARLDIA